MSEKLTVKPQDLLPGDVFKHRHVTYEVLNVTEGSYSTYRVKAKRLSAEELGLDYSDDVIVERAPHG
jgi:hypothetical protein